MKNITLIKSWCKLGKNCMGSELIATLSMTN